MPDRYIHQLDELGVVDADDEIIISQTSEPDEQLQTKKSKISTLPGKVVKVDLEAYARVANPAASDTDGLDFKLGNPKAISEIDMAIGASAEATDTALGSNFVAPAVWYRSNCRNDISCSCKWYSSWILNRY